MLRAPVTGAIGAVLALGLAMGPVTSVAADETSPAPNNPPLTAPDTVTVAAGITVMADVLANDSDPDGDALTLAEAYLPDPAAGTARALHGKVEFVAAAGFLGVVNVTYRAEDGRGGAANGQLTVTIVAPTAPPTESPTPTATPTPSPSKRGNHKPSAAADRVSVAQGESLVIDVLSNDSDPDGDAISVKSVGSAGHGRTRVTGGKVEYLPKSAFSGTDRFRYTVKDARGATARATVTVTVIARPTPEPTSEPTPEPTANPGTGTSRRDIEAALNRLGLPTGAVNGKYDARTRRALCAWRTVAGRSANRRLPSAAEARAIVSMDQLPSALGSMVTGLNISKTCQAAFWVSSGNSYRAVMPATTGKSGYATRSGLHRVFIDWHTWRRSTIYTTAWMYHPKQFSGGQAVHGSSTDRLVKTYPASHGCVRMLHRDIDRLEDGGFGLGSQVRVFGAW